jgi:hypothetical protein
MNPTEWILKNLSASELTEESSLKKYIDRDLITKERALDVINAHLYKHVMANYNAFGTILTNREKDNFLFFIHFRSARDDAHSRTWYRSGKICFSL